MLASRRQVHAEAVGSKVKAATEMCRSTPALGSLQPGHSGRVAGAALKLNRGTTLSRRDRDAKWRLELQEAMKGERYVRLPGR